MCFFSTCNSCISFSPNLVLKISFVIFSWSSSKCSGLKPGRLFSPRCTVGDVPFVLVSFCCDFSSSNFAYFGGMEITPRCERFRSFSRMSINCCENLKFQGDFQESFSHLEKFTKTTQIFFRREIQKEFVVSKKHAAGTILANTCMSPICDRKTQNAGYVTI